MDEIATSGCPKCGRTDAVRKLSLQYTEGALLHEDTAGNNDLAPPSKPKPKGPSARVEEWVKAAVGSTWEYVGCLNASLVFFVMMTIPLMAWLTFSFWLSSTLLGVPFSVNAPVPKIIVFLAVLLFIIPPSILLYRERKKERVFLAEKLPPWRSAVEQWAGQFHCDRCKLAFSSDKPIPLGGPLPEIGGGESLSADWRADVEKAVPFLVGVGRSGDCLACGQTVHGIRFSDGDYRKLWSEHGLATVPVTTAVACPGCDGLVCLNCTKNALGVHKSWTELAKAACPGCGQSMATPDFVVQTDWWYDVLLRSIGLAALAKRIEQRR